MIATEPVGPDRARVQLRRVRVQLRGDVGQAGREGLGLPDQVVEDQRPAEGLLGRRLHQRRLKSREPRPAHLIRPALYAQDLRGLQLSVGDVHAHHLIRRTDAPVDRLGQGQGVAPAAERSVRIVLHRRDQLTGHPRAGVVVQLPQSGCGGHVQPPQCGDAGVVVHGRPGLADPPRGPVRLVHDHQVPARKPGRVRPLQRAEPERGIRGEHRHPVERPNPVDQLLNRRGVREDRLIPVQ